MPSVAVYHEPQVGKREQLLTHLDQQKGSHGKLNGVAVLEIPEEITRKQKGKIQEWISGNPDGKMVVVAAGDPVTVKRRFGMGGKKESLSEIFQGAEVTRITDADLMVAQNEHPAVDIPKEGLITIAASAILGSKAIKGGTQRGTDNGSYFNDEKTMGIPFDELEALRARQEEASRAPAQRSSERAAGGPREH